MPDPTRPNPDDISYLAGLVRRSTGRATTPPCLRRGHARGPRALRLRRRDRTHPRPGERCDARTDPPAMVAGCAAGGGGARSRARTRPSAHWGASSPGTRCRFNRLADRRAQRRPLFRSAPVPGGPRGAFRQDAILAVWAGRGDRRHSCAGRRTGRARCRPRLRPGASPGGICRRPGARADDPDGRPARHGGLDGRDVLPAARGRPSQGGGGARRSGAAPSQGRRRRSRAFRGAFCRLSCRSQVAPLLDRMQQLDAEILERPASLSDLETILRIGIAKFRGRLGAVA